VPSPGGKYVEVIHRLVGLDPEPEGPALVGVVIRCPDAGGDSFEEVIMATSAIAARHLPTWPGSVEVGRIDVMLGGDWEAVPSPSPGD
jgi:hypothetical protein